MHWQCPDWCFFLLLSLIMILAECIIKSFCVTVCSFLQFCVTCRKTFRLELNCTSYYMLTWPIMLFFPPCSWYNGLPQWLPWRSEWNFFCGWSWWGSQETGSDHLWMPYASHRLWWELNYFNCKQALNNSTDPMLCELDILFGLGDVVYSIFVWCDVH